MVKPAIVKISRIDTNGISINWEGKCLIIKSFDFSKKLTIHVPMGSMTIYDVADFIVGCFVPQSTFDWVNVVTFTFNTITVTVTRGEALGNSEYIVNKWKEAWDNDLKR